MSDRGRARFQEMDLDGDGFVTKKEARKARKAMKGKMKAKLKAWKKEREASTEE